MQRNPATGSVLKIQDKGSWLLCLGAALNLCFTAATCAPLCWMQAQAAQAALLCVAFSLGCSSAFKVLSVSDSAELSENVPTLQLNLAQTRLPVRDHHLWGCPGKCKQDGNLSSETWAGDEFPPLLEGLFGCSSAVFMPLAFPHRVIVTLSD